MTDHAPPLEADPTPLGDGDPPSRNRFQRRWLDTLWPRARVFEVVSTIVALAVTTFVMMMVVHLNPLNPGADLVFDDNALVRITLPDGADPDALRVWLDDTRQTSTRKGDRDVTAAFAERPNGEIEGVVRGLRVGTNELTARLPDGRGAWLTITNHPRGGPIFSGPQLQPWRCQPTATDAQCNGCS